LQEVLENMDDYKVIIGFERLGIGGGEGSVSVFRTPPLGTKSTDYGLTQGRESNANRWGGTKVLPPLF